MFRVPNQLTRVLSLFPLLFLPLCTIKAQGLKDLFSDFQMGTALSAQDVNQGSPEVLKVLSTHFSSITPENLLKWQSVHHEPGRYDFMAADEFVNLGENLGVSIIGHTLVWHQQTPDWVFEREDKTLLSKTELLARMEEHIGRVAGRYKGRIHGWDVVNEAFTDDGKYRSTKWFNIAGKDFIKQAFIKASATDPEAELYYNDYNLWKPAKLDAVLEMAMELKASGVRIDGIGMQGHWGLGYPSLSEIEASIQKIAHAGLKVMITELDIDVLPKPSHKQGADTNDSYRYHESFNPYKDGLPEEVKRKLAQRYEELFLLFQKHRDVISRITLWGIRDTDSWLNNWPIKGRRSYPLLFDEDYQEKEYIFEKLRSVKVAG